MKEGFDLTIVYNGQNVDAHLFAFSAEERQIGIEVMWYVEIYINGNSHKILSISEYPEGAFTEIERDPLLTTPLDTFKDLILTNRRMEE
jgi:hypothetical protein